MSQQLRHGAGLLCFALSGAYLVLWAIQYPAWWNATQAVFGRDLPTVALAVPWALLTLLGAFLYYNDFNREQKQGGA